MKDIIGYEGLYAATEDGQIWSHYKNRVLKTRTRADGYVDVGLTKDGVKKTLLVHRLVAQTYIPNPLNLPAVNHLDENKSNNSISNLCWTTEEQNNNYGTRNQRAGKNIRKSVYCIELDKVFESVSIAAEEFGLSQGNLSSHLRGNQKSFGGYHWRYADELLGQEAS